MSSAIQIYKKNPTQGEITSSLTGSTGDGAGLHFEDGGYVDLANNAAAEFGTSDFSVEFILNQTGETASGNFLYFTHTGGNNRLYVRNHITSNNVALIFTNSSGASTTRSIAYDMTADYNTPTHYVLTFDRDGYATLYKNGNSVGSIDISAESGIDIGAVDDSGANNTTTSRFGSSSTYGTLGTFYRFRTWNKLVDAKALFERADVEYSSQYGTTTAPFTSINLSSGWSVTSSPLGVIDDANSYTTPGSGSGVLYPITVGKKYRLTWNVTGSAFDGPRMVTVGESYIAIPDAPSSGTLTGTLEFTATKEKLYLRNGSAGTVDINSMSLVQIGAVVDMDLSAANPTQSLIVQDRAGSADATCSASGVTQVQPIIQGNVTSLVVGTGVGTPADGQIIVDGKAASAPSYSFEHTTATGMYSPGANKINFSTASTDRLKIDGSGNVTVNGPVGTNFGDSTSLGLEVTSAGHQRVKVHSTSTTGHAVAYDLETGNTGPVAHTGSLKLSGAGALSMQTAGSDRLSIDSTGNVTQKGAVLKVERDDNAPALQLYNNHDSPADSAALGYVSFTGKDNNGTANQTYANIGGHCESNTDTNVSGYLTFNTTSAGTATSERMRISSTGHVSMTSSDADAQLTLTGTGTNAPAKIDLVPQGTGNARIQVGGSDKITIASDGLCTFSSINLGDTTLSNYAEATWTPTVGGDATYSAQTGRYTRVGRLVTATFDLTINAIGTGSTYIVSGLPFNSGDSIGAGGNINYYSSLAVSPVLFAPTVAGSTVHIRSATSAAASPSNHGILGNGSRIAGIVTYTV